MVSRASSSRRKAPISRFSSTVIEAKTLRTWGTKPMPALTRSCGLSAVMSRSRSRTWPRRSGSMPNSAFIAVDLPAPLGPTITAISPLSTAMVQSWRMSAAP